jgi:hypothetical protein
VDGGAEEPLDEKSGHLISGYEIAQRSEDGALAEALAFFEKARRGRRETDALAFQAFEGVHPPLERDKGFVGAKELSSRRGLALAHLPIVAARGVEIRGRHTKAGDSIDRSQGGFVALAPNERQGVRELSALGVERVGAVRDLIELSPGALTLVVDTEGAVICVAEPPLSVFDGGACRGHDAA